jgi:hypothetical protein
MTAPQTRILSALPLVRLAVTAAPVTTKPITAANASRARHFSFSGRVNPSPEVAEVDRQAALIGIDLGRCVVGHH